VADFDAYADSYRDAVTRSISFCGREVDYFARRKADKLFELSRRLVGNPADLSVLDVGCGIGTTEPFLTPRFGSVHGIDVAAEAVEHAAADNPDAQFQTYSGETLPIESASLDVVFAACVLHHVPSSGRAAFALEMQRVTRPGGLVVVFEHNPANPLTRIAVSRCEFDEGVELLSHRETAGLLRASGLTGIESAYIVFFPWDRRPLPTIERWLRRVPLGAQYLVAGRKVAVTSAG
jgi:SAM-dependent methyltransferase